MKRYTPRVPYLASTTTSAICATMSLRPSFRGSYCLGQGQGRDRRNYSARPYGDEGVCTSEFVNGETHFQQVRVANQGFQLPQHGGGVYNDDFHPYNYNPPVPHNYNQLPPHIYNQLQPHDYNHLLPPPQQYFDQNHRPQPQPQPQPQPPHQSYYNQQFRPPLWQNQFRPRPPKQFQYRNWEYAAPGPPPQCERFTILSYNILADYLIRDHWSKLYFHIPNYILDWKERKRRIIFELCLWSADILCFQEVDRFADLKEELELQGYNGIWKRRTGVPVDGCAIFWRNSRFKLLHEESLEFCKLGMRDNVAQICVFQSLDQCKDSATSASISSSNKANKVVICNIHVLFNPKRGEIKLGQVRVLLNRAHAVSTLWDDAPIVISGDFNCTPKSALYNFIAEQKLDLSELSRDKVSGQTAAEIHPSRPYNPNSMNSGQPESSTVRDSVESSISKKPREPMENSLDEMNRHGDGNDATNHLLDNNSSKSPSLLQDKASSWSCLSSIHDSALQNSCFDDAEFDSKNVENEERRYSDRKFVDSSKHEGKSSLEFSVTNSLDDPLQGSVDVLSSLPSLSAATQDSTSIAYAAGGYDVLHESIDKDFPVDGKMERLSLDEVVEGTTEGENIGEDQISFLSELHSTSSDEFGYQLKEQFRPEIEQSSLVLEQRGITLENSKYDPSTWTPVEVETATGSAHCSVMEHPLKLRSVYKEIQDYSGTRDSTGEPAVTSYHRRFLGTVDYIWRSEGLQTVRVLAPMPKHAMLWTHGFPTKKWGSDHIALVSELAFTDDTSQSKPSNTI